jgi:predicted amidohydrolase
MNRIYIATANRTGTEGNVTFNGQSFFTNPAGEILNKLTREQSGISTLEIDTNLSRNKMITARNHVFNDRRPEAYLP